MWRAIILALGFLGLASAVFSDVAIDCSSLLEFSDYAAGGYNAWVEYTQSGNPGRYISDVSPRNIAIVKANCNSYPFLSDYCDKSNGIANFENSDAFDDYWDALVISGSASIEHFFNQNIPQQLFVLKCYQEPWDPTKDSDVTDFVTQAIEAGDSTKQKVKDTWAAQAGCDE